MKQHITLTQLNELSVDNQFILAQNVPGIPDIFYPEDLLLSIGQMIEFLDGLSKYKYWWEYGILKATEGEIWPEKENLCNSLWEAVKKEL